MGECGGFKLRKSSPSPDGGHSNVCVGNFEERAEGVYIVDYAPDAATLETDIYQIYPAEENKCFYSLEEGATMFVHAFCSENGKAVQCARHTDFDQYCYFLLPENTTAILIIIVAAAASAASSSGSERLNAALTLLK